MFKTLFNANIRWLKRIILVAVLGSSVNAQAKDQKGTPGDDTIYIYEPKSRQFEANTKLIICDRFQWYLTWSVDLKSKNVTGEVKAYYDGTPLQIKSVQKKLFDHFSTIDTISTTCRNAPKVHSSKAHFKGYSKTQVDMVEMFIYISSDNQVDISK